MPLKSPTSVYRTPETRTCSFIYRHFLFCSKTWMNLYCVLSKGEIVFYKDAKNTTTPYNGEAPLDLSLCTCDITNGYKKKKYVFILK